MSELQHGFELIREEYIDELNTTAYLYRHVKSGAELLSMVNDDENKVFGITFRTTPTDSSGVAHIMEHSVLAGSEKYPLKEPFIELVKGSLQTFLNAFTYPDKTCYPVASQNEKDFYNLIDVYLDAVFHPLLTKHHLEQEGWHYEIDEANEELIYKGVVFNEMKGAYSSPEALLHKHTHESLFPATHTYGVDSGGNPDQIPALTFEQFSSFHKDYYHPANSRIWFYGDDEPTQRLAVLDAYLRDFDAIDVSHTAVPPIELRQAPEEHTFPYPVDAAGETEPKNYVRVNWLLPPISDPETKLALAILSHALSGTVGSPLRKALIDSGLGEDVIGGGFVDYLQQMYFGVGLKGVDQRNVEAVKALVIDTLTDLAQNGVAAESIEAAVNTLEFRLRENNTGSYPRGLILMLAALGSWLYDEDPLISLRYEAPLAAVKEAWAANPAYFSDLIQTYVLDNTHRVAVVLEPDTELAEQKEQAERERLAAVQETLSVAELDQITKNAAELKKIQETPDDPAALAKLPMLTLDDIDRGIRTIPIDVTREEGAEIVYHDLFTNGIVYFSAGFNMRVIPQELLPYVPLFSYALTEMGTTEEDYVQLSQRIGRTTGGVRASYMMSNRRDQPEAVAWLSVRGKATMDQTADMLAIIQDVLQKVNLDNLERFRQMVLEEKAGEEAGIVPAGHSVVMGRLGAHFSEAGYLNEQMGGLDYLFFIRRLADEVVNEWDSVLSKLQQIQKLLVNRNNMLVNITLDGANWSLFRPQLIRFLQSFPAFDVVPQQWQRGQLPQNEGLTIPARVNYVGKAANLYDLGYTHHGSVSVITNHLRTGYLWERVRMRGGAYGAMVNFSQSTGLFALASYRDPNLLETLDVYDGLADHLHHVDLSADELTKSIIGVIGSMDAYQLPDAKGYTSLSRYLLGISEEYLQARRDEILSTEVKHFREFADVLQQMKQQGIVAVVGSAEAINKANEARGSDWLSVRKIM